MERKSRIIVFTKKFCSCQGVFDTSLMAENKDRTRCPGWISESTRTPHGQLLLGELGAKWGKQGHYLAILEGFSERIIHWIMCCFCWASVRLSAGFGRRGWLSKWQSRCVTVTELCDCHTPWQGMEPVRTYCFCHLAWLIYGPIINSWWKRAGSGTF